MKTEEEKARQRETIVKLLSQSLKAKRERDKAQEEAEKDLPKAECAPGSTGSKEEPEEKVDFDQADLRSLWDQQNTDSEGEYESLSSTECNDPEPIILKLSFSKI